MKKRKGNTVAIVWDIVKPFADELGLILWDVRFIKEGATWFLRIFIDKDGGVSMDDCVDLTHAINKPIDDADPIDQSYCLEVSSTGLERELIRDFHFHQMIGQELKVRLIRPDENSQKEYIGNLLSYNDAEIKICLSDATERTFNKKDTAWVKLNDYNE